MNEAAESGPGLEAREGAEALVAAVLMQGRALDEALAEEAARGRLARLTPSDRGFARAIAATALRHLGEIDHALGLLLEKPLPRRAGLTETILRSAAAEILFLDVKPHAAVSLAVEAASRDEAARHFKSLVNAVLRRLAREGHTLLDGFDRERANLAPWLWESWVAAYGEERTRAMLRALWEEPPLDLFVKREEERELWAARLGAEILPTGSLRLAAGGRIERLDGYEEGAWWVQDAAAALPARLFGDLRGRDVLDLCAAPGGKTLQLAAMGAHVTALDRSAPRLERLRQNLARMKLEAGIVVSDAVRFTPGRLWDFILLDAPCTATGTFRRHPDVLRLKKPADRDRLAALQSRLLAHVAGLLAPGGTLVYCTCSLERAEGEDQIASFLAAHPDFARQPIAPAEIGGLGECLTPEGDLRTLPCDLAGKGGLDGFFAARLTRLSRNESRP